MEKSNQSTSKTLRSETYESPSVEVIEVAVEKGFALSGTGQDGNWR